jgi:hypothetical protein
MKTKDLILVALICANVTLASVALALWVGKAEPSAMASSSSSSRAGDYVMITGPITNSRDGLLVIDVVAKKANFYAPKAGAAGAASWELTTSRPLASDFLGR